MAVHAAARAGSAGAADAAPRRELRLALVCYGGSSLAIYMHGVTKETQRLVKASAIVDAGLEPSVQSKSEQAYAALLRKLAEQSQVLTRVVVDVIAGTSAGGINGIYLAKALAHNRSQDALRDLWFERGDMHQLMLLPRSWPIRLRLALLLPRTLKRSPLRGGEMARWLHDALTGMDDTPQEPGAVTTLMPEGGLLELFVTITDFYGYDRQIPIDDPKLVHDQRHRHALTFTYEPGGEDHFGPGENGSLAFAARTTSCFPGVFPPVSFSAFKDWVPEADVAELDERGFREYTLAGAKAGNTQFIDGGVLDNKPFGWAIGAITRRRADVEVDRRLLYLQPDPGDRFLTPAELNTPKPAPTTVKALLGATGRIPRSEPILDDLLALEDHNERVQRIRDVIETCFSSVSQIVDGILGPQQELPANPEDGKLAEWAAAINKRTIDEAGIGYSAYLRIKISGAVDRYAQTVCEVCDFPDDSNHAQLVQTVLRCWAEDAGLFEQQPEPTQRQLDFLRDLDLGYGQRRLRFVISGLRWWYRDLEAGEPGIPPRGELDRGKQLLYDAADKLRRTMGGEDFGDDLAAAVRACFPDDGIRDFLAANGLDGPAYLKQHGAELQAAETQLRTFVNQQLQGFTAQLYRELYALSANWLPVRREELLVRYLGFPLWDLVLYPIQAFADAGENDHVEVLRMSPYEAHVLSTPPDQKVQGKKLMHFWAFFDRRARENDYLWGRLDGAAHLIGILLGKDDPDYAATCLESFAAILDEEEAALPHITETVQALRTEIASRRA
jgi:patatin-related protein